MVLALSLVHLLLKLIHKRATTRHEFGLLPLPEGERGGVRGWAIYRMVPTPLTRPRSRAGDLSPLGRGKFAARLCINSIETRSECSHP
jgi:hypothetical protein